MRSLITIALIAAASVGCGGTWENDPNNWQRIFRDEKPPDIQVVNSFFWQSSHWSYEFSYHIHIAPNARFEADLKETWHLVPGTQPGPRRWIDDPESNIWSGEVNDWSRCMRGPEWFAPGSTESYEIWVEPDDDGWDHLTLYIKKESRDLFLCDYQL